MMRHWSREGPPAYIAVATYLGLRAPPPSAETLAGEDLMNLLAAFPGGELRPGP